MNDHMIASGKYINQPKSRFQAVLKGLKRTKYLQLLMIPALIYYIIFHYVPMYGIIIAFEDYKISQGFFGSQWVGLDNFIRFFNHPYFFRLLKNTLLIQCYGLIWGFPAPILLALMLNEVRNKCFKRIVQTVSYLPHFISTVAIVGILTVILSPRSGFVNEMLGIFNIEPIYFMAETRWFRTVYIASGIWQGVGWGAIIYLAAISNVDVQLYESAIIDGATRLDKIWYITLPGIMPTVVIMLIMNIGTMFKMGCEKIILMYSPVNYEVSDVISSYIYRRGLQYAEYSYSTAVGFFNSVVSIIMLVAANALARRISETSLW